MRALVYRETGLVLDTHYPQPELMNGEALIRVLQAGICNTDLEITRGYMAFQGVLGHEFVGIVEAVHEGPGASPTAEKPEHHSHHSRPHRDPRSAPDG